MHSVMDLVPVDKFTQSLGPSRAETKQASTDKKNIDQKNWTLWTIFGCDEKHDLELPYWTIISLRHYKKLKNQLQLPTISSLKLSICQGKQVQCTLHSSPQKWHKKLIRQRLINNVGFFLVYSQRIWFCYLNEERRLKSKNSLEYVNGLCVGRQGEVLAVLGEGEAVHVGTPLHAPPKK